MIQHNSGQCADCGGAAYVDKSDGYIGEFCNDCLKERYVQPKRKRAYYYTGPRAGLEEVLKSVHGDNWVEGVTDKAINRAGRQSRYTGRGVDPEWYDKGRG